MYSTTPPTHTDPQYGNTTSSKSLLCAPLHHQHTLTISMVLHQYQESDMYSTTPPTHTHPQYGNTTSTKSLTCTPLHHQPTLTLSMVTPPVARVCYVLLYTTNPLTLSMVLHQYQESDMYSTTPPTHTHPQYGNTTSTKSLTCTPLHHQPTLTISMVTSPVPWA